MMRTGNAPGADQPTRSVPQPPLADRKKPWRYRWPDDFRDEVLARLLALNKERAEQERLTGIATKLNRAKKSSPKTSKLKGNLQLFEDA